VISVLERFAVHGDFWFSISKTALVVGGGKGIHSYGWSGMNFPSLMIPMISRISFNSSPHMRSTTSRFRHDSDHWGGLPLPRLTTTAPSCIGESVRSVLPGLRYGVPSVRPRWFFWACVLDGGCRARLPLAVESPGWDSGEVFSRGMMEDSRLRPEWSVCD
jgi:hypothetical protein